MFTVNFYTTVEVLDEETQASCGTFTFKKTVKFPYVPRVGEQVRFGDDSMPIEARPMYVVENVILDVVDREFDVILEGFLFDPPDVDDATSALSQLGFAIVRYDEVEEDDDGVDQNPNDEQPSNTQETK